MDGPHHLVGERDNLMLAVLWTWAPEAALAHEAALDAYGISDVNPNRIHLTVGKQRRAGRAGGEDYVGHYEDLAAKQVGWWQEIPMATPAISVAQCLVHGTPTYLPRRAIETPSLTTACNPFCRHYGRPVRTNVQGRPARSNSCLQPRRRRWISRRSAIGSTFSYTFTRSLQNAERARSPSKARRGVCRTYPSIVRTWSSGRLGARRSARATRMGGGGSASGGTDDGVTEHQIWIP